MAEITSVATSKEIALQETELPPENGTYIEEDPLLYDMEILYNSIDTSIWFMQINIIILSLISIFLLYIIIKKNI